MKISIITVSFNSAKTIEKTISSVMEQTFDNIEYIIIDGNSGDDTVSIIKRHEKKNIRLISESDKGIYDAMNKGINLATGDVIGFVHSDDLLASPMILENISKIMKEENIDGVYGDLVYVDKTNTNKVIRYWKSKAFNSSLLNKGWMPPHPTLFLRKKVYEKHGYFNLEYKIASDYDLMLRIFGDNTLIFKYLPMLITNMRVGGKSNKNFKNIFKKSYEDYRALKTNKISNPLWVLFQKNIAKLPQFFYKQAHNYLKV